MCLFSFVTVANSLMFFECFYCCLPCSIWIFVKIFPYFYEQIKRRQAIGSILPPRITSPWKHFKSNKPKGLRSFWKVKILGWFIHIGEHVQQLCLKWLYITLNITYEIWMKVLLRNELNDFCLETLCFLAFKYSLFRVLFQFQ